MRNLLMFVAILVSGLASVSPVQADEVVGAIWKVDFKDDKSSMRMQCTKNHKVFGPAGKELGTWEQKGAKAVLKITSGGKRNGTYDITQMGKKPPTYRGEYSNDKGESVKINVTLVKD